MKFSIIIPSYNQSKYIERTLQNVIELKIEAAKSNIEVELLLYDSCSDKEVQDIIKKYAASIDYIEIIKDKGQYDAINKGMRKASGDYWTWLNTDDLIEPSGFFNLTQVLMNDHSIDYIYGSVDIIDANDRLIKTVNSYKLTKDHLLNVNPAVFQPGSFFKKNSSDKLGALEENSCCFDYEYVLRLLSNNAKIYKCDFVVSKFRYYPNSKSGSMVPVFIREQLKISRKYGRRSISFMTIFLNLRLVKHFLFPSR